MSETLPFDTFYCFKYSCASFVLSYLEAFIVILGISSFEKCFLQLFFDWNSRFPKRGRRKDETCHPFWVHFIELEGACSDGFLSSVSQREIYLRDVFKFDISKELFETLVKNKDLGSSLQTFTQGRSMGICIFNHHPRSVLLTLKNGSEYKSRLLWGFDWLGEKTLR